MSGARSFIEKWRGLLGVGVASAVAYRGEFLVWILTTNLPLIMMALWTTVAAEGPVGRFGQRGFVAYFLGALLVRFLSGSWVVWQLTWDIREGGLGPRLLKPMHPFAYYAGENLAQIPLRLLVSVPLVLALVVGVGPAALGHDYRQWLLLPVLLLGAWLVLYTAMLVVASLALFVDSALAVWELWMAVGYVLSGYLMPFELLPAPLRRVAWWLPWRVTLALPLETLLGLCSVRESLAGLALQLVWVTVFGAAALALWRRGMRRFAAFGG
ncbi:MAG: ABC-2 family transporter protein [Myxococcales bacterium]|nr:ABC-2 family transporter protein [Myxococcales bacterium]